MEEKPIPCKEKNPIQTKLSKSIFSKKFENNCEISFGKYKDIKIYFQI